MSKTNDSILRNRQAPISQAEIISLLEIGDWETLDQLTGFTPETVERMLREGSWIDADEVNRRLEEAGRTTEQSKKPDGNNAT